MLSFYFLKGKSVGDTDIDMGPSKKLKTTPKKKDKRKKPADEVTWFETSVFEK